MDCGTAKGCKDQAEAHTWLHYKRHVSCRQISQGVSDKDLHQAHTFSTRTGKDANLGSMAVVTGPVG